MLALGALMNSSSGDLQSSCLRRCMRYLVMSSSLVSISVFDVRCLTASWITFLCSCHLVVFRPVSPFIFLLRSCQHSFILSCPVQQSLTASSQSPSWCRFLFLLIVLCLPHSFAIRRECHHAVWSVVHPWHVYCPSLPAQCLCSFHSPQSIPSLSVFCSRLKIHLFECSFPWLFQCLRSDLFIVDTFIDDLTYLLTLLTCLVCLPHLDTSSLKVVIYEYRDRCFCYSIISICDFQFDYYFNSWCLFLILRQLLPISVTKSISNVQLL